MASKSEIKRIATQSKSELSRQLRRIAKNLRKLQQSHLELPFLHGDGDWIDRAADVLDALKSEGGSSAAG